MRIALASIVLMALGSASLAAQPESSAEDPYIWLEDIQGERALAKVDQWNAATEAVLTAAPAYPIARAWAKQILDDDSEGWAETSTFLDRRIDNVMQFEKWKAQWRGQEHFSLSRFLGRLRYPPR
jgi:prolyl oligopeptidase PreP (S9A serine peptidase family)